MSLEIIGAGYGRTGTRSMKIALEKLGYDKCYHMEELFTHPEGVVHWNKASEGADPDWDTLFQGYKAAVDFPASMYYKELADHYPDAKVILTARDPDSWYQSVTDTIYKYDPGIPAKLKLIAQLPFSAHARNFLKVLMHNENTIWKKYFQDRFSDRTHTIDKYVKHNQEVKKLIPENRLLIFEVKDGWKPLCDFLGKPVPDEPFPRTNSKADFHEWAKTFA